jgi:hypothetical protein
LKGLGHLDGQFVGIEIVGFALGGPADTGDDGNVALLQDLDHGFGIDLVNLTGVLIIHSVQDPHTPGPDPIAHDGHDTV